MYIYTVYVPIIHPTCCATHLTVCALRVAAALLVLAREDRSHLAGLIPHTHTHTVAPVPSPLSPTPRYCQFRGDAAAYVRAHSAHDDGERDRGSRAAERPATVSRERPAGDVHHRVLLLRRGVRPLRRQLRQDCEFLSLLECLCFFVSVCVCWLVFWILPVACSGMSQAKTKAAQVADPVLDKIKRCLSAFVLECFHCFCVMFCTSVECYRSGRPR